MKSIIGATLGILLLMLVGLHGQQYTLAPSPYQYVVSSAFQIVPNGCVWTYAAGTTTAIATYADTAGTLNGNPIIADNFGRFTAYLLPGTNYKFQFENTPCSAPSTHGALLKTQDNIQGVPASAANVDIVGTAGEALTAGQCVYLSDGSGAKTQGQWYKCDSANGYSSTLPAIGMPVANIALGTSGTIRTAGYVTGLSSLTVGAPYYVGTAGALTASAPANRRLVGHADTTTTLVTVADPSLMTGLASGTPSSTTFLRGDQTWNTPLTGWTVVTVTTTGSISDWAPGIISGGSTEVRMNNASLTSINSISASGIADGTSLRIVAVGAGQVDLAHETGATTANRLRNFVTSASTSLAPPTSNPSSGGVAEYQYDGTTTRWRLINHVQGAPISWTPIFGGGTSESGQVYTTQIGKYVLVGTVLHVQGNLTLSTLGTITGNVRIKGLPFTIITGGAANYGGLQINYFSALTTSVVWLSAFAVINTTHCELTKLTAAATAISNVVQADLSATTSMFFGGTLAVQ